MTRTRVRTGRLAAVLALVLVAVLLVAQAASGRTDRGGATPNVEVHVVRAGDTLWEVARSVVGPEGDPRPVVAEIREANGLGTAPLTPGLRLVLPAA